MRESTADEEDFTLYWAEIEAIAKQLFRMWWNGSELKWAEVAWEHIVAAGYVHGGYGTEYCRARLRFLALGTFYADWCSVATEEELEPEVQYYAEVLELNPFYLGLMLGPDYELDGQDRFGFYDDEIALANAVRELVRRERPIVATALLAGFKSPSDLFISLWKTRYPVIEQRDESKEDAASDATETATPSEAEAGRQLPLLIELPDAEDDDTEDEYDEAMLSDEEILNDVTAEKLEAWEWINGGCPPLN